MKVERTLFHVTTPAVALIALLSSAETMQSSYAFTVNTQSRSYPYFHNDNDNTLRGISSSPGTSATSSSTRRSPSQRLRPLYVASIPRTNKRTSNNNLNQNKETNIPSSIDDELSAQQQKLQTTKSIMHEMHSILDDGNGQINKELATSIWTWENENLRPDLENDPFPLASKLTYSTRDGLRLIETNANEIMKQIDLHNIDDDENEELYNDLVQEGVVALMKAYHIVWEETNSSNPKNFELFATKEIKKAMRDHLRQTSDGVGVFLDLLQRKAEELEQLENASIASNNNNSNSGGTNVQTKKRSRKNTRIEPCDQIVQPLQEAVLDENPTPDEIALSNMIRNDIDDFLERTLNEEELIVIRMRFGLEEVDTTLKAISLNLGKSVNDVQEIEYNALCKLRTSFSNDYIGAYLDCDNTEEVSL